MVFNIIFIFIRECFLYRLERAKIDLGSKDKCAICAEKIELPFNPMKEWGIEGTICGDCYSKKLHEHYPGDHIRVNKDLD